MEVMQLCLPLHRKSLGRSKPPWQLSLPALIIVPIKGGRNKQYPIRLVKLGLELHPLQGMHNVMGQGILRSMKTTPTMPNV